MSEVNEVSIHPVYKTPQEHQLAGLQGQLEDAQAAVELAQAIYRLEANPDFRKVVLDEFCLRQCALSAQRSSFPSLTPAARADALAQAQAAGWIRTFMNTAKQMGQHAMNQIPSIQEDMDVVRAGGDEG